MGSPLIDFTPHYAQAGAQPFTDRRATMPWRPTAPIPPEQVQAQWQSLVSQAAPARKRLLYLHVPFCATHCKFCAFYQNRYKPESCEQYTQYLLREIDMESGNPLHQSAPIHAVYFGGGTPSALAAKDLFRIIQTLRTRLPLAPDCEITIEGRILDFDDDRIDACLDAGANRFSIGIQTFNSRIRKQMGRTSDGPQARRFIEGLSKRDRAAIVCDLLFGLPGQNAENWAEDLTIAQGIGLDGVDLYALNLLPGTPLAKAAENKRVTIPTPLERRDLYLQGCQMLDDAGWRHISNSHWACTTRERNLYNLLIKRGADCLAMGAGGGGSVNGRTYMVERQLSKYYQAIEQQQKPLMMMMHSTADHQWRHALQAGVEIGRIPLPEITPHAQQLAPLLSQWHQAGLTKDAGTCIRLTDEGRFWASNLLQSLQQLILQLNSESPTSLPQRNPPL